MGVDAPERSTGRSPGRLLMLLGALLVAVVMILPLWASLRYRLAVGRLHRELATVELEAAELVETRVDGCWNGEAPASIRILRPVSDSTVVDLRDHYQAALASLGFSPTGVGVDRVASRERDDSLDGDIVRFEVDQAAGTLTVIADAYDADMVFCLPS